MTSTYFHVPSLLKPPLAVQVAGAVVTKANGLALSRLLLDGERAPALAAEVVWLLCALAAGPGQCVAPLTQLEGAIDSVVWLLDLGAVRALYSLERGRG
jgi:hypothetical protein